MPNRLPVVGAQVSSLVEATEGGSRSDIASWAKDMCNGLLDSSGEDGVHYVIRKE